jgi:hypothetical protein
MKGRAIIESIFAIIGSLSFNSEFFRMSPFVTVKKISQNRDRIHVAELSYCERFRILCPCALSNLEAIAPLNLILRYHPTEGWYVSPRRSSEDASAARSSRKKPWLGRFLKAWLQIRYQDVLSVEKQKIK